MLYILHFRFRPQHGNQRGINSNKRLDEKAEQEATGFLLDLVSVSGDNGLKLPRGIYSYIRYWPWKDMRSVHSLYHTVVGQFQLAILEHQALPSHNTPPFTFLPLANARF